MIKLVMCVSVYLLLEAGNVYAQALRVAVAANFAEPLKELATAFERTTGHQITIISGSSGKLHAQIVRGAPFDVFLSADTQKPRALIEQGIATCAFTYARGQLVLLVSKKALARAGTSAWLEWLNAPSAKRIALANPLVAPYGIAAQQVLERMSDTADTNQHNAQHKALASKKTQFINAENISQVAHYVNNRSVDAGFIAASLLPSIKGETITPLTNAVHWRGMRHWWLWDIPEEMYSAILQQGVILPRANAEVANAFRQFLLSAQAQAILRANWGYLMITPDDEPMVCNQKSAHLLCCGERSSADWRVNADKVQYVES
ncbi:molybdate ABC transporter substrate-binding protein [Marinagarivorans algicola]|uniref:molybdate ABC transporter substrate-binding protein n=1 Tax=Marinagarivorans algicola TaxID=1513270 RepID=UPI000A4EDE42|nr:molybdate ABC transporter substrate-binding protein [Marinagarivorans algicola]